jgi:hypothetical protein
MINRLSVTNSLDIDCINCLQCIEESADACVNIDGDEKITTECERSMETSLQSDPSCDSNFIDVDQFDNEAIDPSIASVAELQSEQLADATLTGSWQLVKRGKGNVFIKDGLLFQVEKICSQPTDALMVPEGRRNHVLDIAPSVTDGHFEYRKRRDRIKLSRLTWSTLTRGCKEWVKRCSVCQKMSRVTCYDRILIQAVPRSPALFVHFVCDVFGPILPDQNLRQ